jgi:hypothetical protein
MGRPDPSTELVIIADRSDLDRTASTDCSTPVSLVSGTAVRETCSRMTAEAAKAPHQTVARL